MAAPSFTLSQLEASPMPRLASQHADGKRDVAVQQNCEPN
jgi:hypothetical protein